MAAAVALLVSLTTLRGEDVVKQGKAVVRAIHGTVQWRVGDHRWQKLRVGSELAAGLEIRTGVDSYTDLSINNAGSIRLTSDSTLALRQMTSTKTLFERRHDETLLNLKSGELSSIVNKKSARSRYELHTPHGTASFDSGVFYARIRKAPDGYEFVTFGSAEGKVACSAEVDGNPVTQTLASEQEWTPGAGGLRQMDPDEAARARSLFVIVCPCFVQPPPSALAPAGLDRLRLAKFPAL